ncbi:MAG: cation transporter [Planctomycetes bacterium]|nr:cation transporter [Planctomycetota bacterium]
MQAALAKVEGVDGVTVDYAKKTAAVHVTKDVNVGELAKALEGAGYGCTNCAQ